MGRLPPLLRALQGTFTKASLDVHLARMVSQDGHAATHALENLCSSVAHVYAKELKMSALLVNQTLTL